MRIKGGHLQDALPLWRNPIAEKNGMVIAMLSLIIDNENNLVWADTEAQRLLGLPESGDKQGIIRVFGSLPLYHRIEQESFNYRWAGQLKVVLADGTRGNFHGRASWVTNERWVFNQIFFEGSLLDTGLSGAADSDAEEFAVQPAQLRKVYEISTSINSNLDFQSICVDVTMKAAELIGADRSLLYNVTDQNIGVFATWNMTEQQRNLFCMVDFKHGIIKNCLRHRSPVLVPAYSVHPDWIPEIYESLRFESFILYPLYAGQRLVGVLALFRREALRFGDRHLMLLQMISNQMAIAVLNAQTYSDMRNITNNLERELGLKASQLRVSELALIRKSNELAAVFDAITDALFVMDGNFVIREINQAGLGFAKVSNSIGLIGRSYCDVVGRRYNCGNCYLRQTLDFGLPQTVEIEVDDRVFTVTTYPVLDEEGRTNQVVCALRDVTIVRKKGAELIQSQKMQAVGTLAAGVAHEIRNPLGAISNYVYILEDQLLPQLVKNSASDTPEIRETISGIRRLVERCETVIRNLLDFSRDKAPNISTFFLRDVIDQILLLVGKTAQKKKVGIIVHGGNSVQVTSDTGAMQHILFNLVLNAIDAIESGGTVNLRYAADKDGFSIIVEDDGNGIEREHLDKIFNPFFTTKAPDRGTGLGLYLVYNEVKRLGGTITVESASGGPTKFTVHFMADGKGEEDNGKR